MQGNDRRAAEGGGGGGGGDGREVLTCEQNKKHSIRTNMLYVETEPAATMPQDNAKRQYTCRGNGSQNGNCHHSVSSSSSGGRHKSFTKKRVDLLTSKQNNMR